MREEITFQIFNQFDKIELASKIYLLKQELIKNKNSVLDLLNNYYYQERGKVDNLNFNTIDIKFLRKMAGQARIELTINYTNACADQQFNERNVMTIDFDINATTKTLRLVCEEKLEREPDEF